MKRKSSDLTPAVYCTSELYLAAYLIVDNKLKYLRCDNVSGGLCRIVFADPNGDGPALAAEYLTGNPSVPLKSLRDVLSLLRNEMRRVTEGANASQPHA